MWAHMSSSHLPLLSIPLSLLCTAEGRSGGAEGRGVEQTGATASGAEGWWATGELLALSTSYSSLFSLSSLSPFPSSCTATLQEEGGTAAGCAEGIPCAYVVSKNS
jgi:hypothetical protein